MTMYYKVRSDKDQTPVYKNRKLYAILIGGELLTTTELQKLQQHDKRFENVNDYFEVVECSRKNSYFCFGARFNSDIKMNKWLLECSIDAIMVDYSEILESYTEPPFWMCEEIANNHGCEFWTVSEFEGV